MGHFSSVIRDLWCLGASEADSMWYHRPLMSASFLIPCMGCHFSRHPRLSLFSLLVVWQHRGLDDFDHKKWVKKAQSTSYLWSLSHGMLGHVFLVHSPTTTVAVRSVLASLDIPCKCWFQEIFGLPNATATCPQNLSKFLFQRPFLFLSLVYYLFLHFSSAMGYICVANPASKYIYLLSWEEG